MVVVAIYLVCHLLGPICNKGVNLGWYSAVGHMVVIPTIEERVQTLLDDTFNYYGA